MGYLTQAVSYVSSTWATIDWKTLALLFGAIWALFKIIQSGGLHPLLDLKVSGKFIWIAGQGHILCSVEVKNVHLPVVPIEYAGLRLSLRKNVPSPPESPSPPVVWVAARKATFPVLEDQEKVWSGETIRDKILIVAPSGENVFLIEFRIGRKYRWYQYPYKWLKRRSSWSAVAIVKREERGGGV